MKHSDKIKYKETKKNQKSFLKMQKKLNLSKFIKVNDDWYPNYPDNKVKIYLRIIGTFENPCLRISVWGADDTGYEKDWQSPINNIEEIIDKYSEWKSTIYDIIPEITNKHFFETLGFVNA